VIAPYSAVLRTLEPKFLSLGLRIAKETDYAVAFGSESGEYTVEIEAERYYRGLTFGLTDRRGKTYTSFGLESILDPGGLDVWREKQAAVGIEFGDNSQAPDNAEKMKAIYEQELIAIGGVLDFLARFQGQLFPVSPWLDAEYDKRYREDWEIKQWN
jgi:hypothetical protein